MRPVRLLDLRTEHLVSPIGVGTARPRFSWIVAAAGAFDVRQDGAEIEVAAEDGAQIWASGRIATDGAVLVEYAGPPLESNSSYRWRVRAWTSGSEAPTAWARASFETTLLHDDDWVAPWIEPEQRAVTPDGAHRFEEMFTLRIETSPAERLHPPILVRQRFELEGRPVRARLYATARGVYQSELNGEGVGDEMLAPGFVSYDRYLPFQAYDVTARLRRGENVLAFQLADGWYAGRVGMLGTSAEYGDRLQLSWQLHVRFDDGAERVLHSDGSARSSREGPIRYSDIAIGECFDARRRLRGWSTPELDDSAWSPVVIVPSSTPLVPFRGEPVRRVLELPVVELLTTPSGDHVLDFGQVIAGRVRMRLAAEAGTVIRLEHGEVLDADGEFFHSIAGPNKDQTDVYVAAGDEDGETWEPLFTFHGFRYVRVTGYPGSPVAGDFTAVVIASDLETTSELTTSDPRLDRLHANVLWSQRGNFLAVPTDCPQRERWGWTGDMQVFAPTAATNMAVVPFLSRWLDNVRADQRPDGSIPNIVPDPPALRYLADEPVPHPDDPGMFVIPTSAGWGDAVVIVPWTLYQRTGDERVLRENYDSMVRWVELQARQAREGLPRRLSGQRLSREQQRRQALLWNAEPHFGDWLAPSTLRGGGPDAMREAPRRTGELIGPMFHGHSLQLLGSIAAVLGRAREGAEYGARARAVREAFAAEYIDERGRLPAELQGVYVLALALRFVPDRLVARSVGRLVTLIHDADDHLDTGFLSVAHLLDVLSDAGKHDLALTLLRQDTAPSWLYEVARGATTIWETWEAIRPDGTVTDSSFNHSAFGCVDDWVFRRVAGLTATSPGYRTILLRPDLTAGLDRLHAALRTPFGRLAVDWRIAPSGRAELRIETPPGTTATLALPDGATDVRVQRGTRVLPEPRQIFGSGVTTVTCMV